MEDKLHNLIINLDRTEKRYFKRYSQKHVLGNQNKYVEIFDILDKQALYNEEELLDALKSKEILSDFISADKYYLYRLILRCLNEYYFEKTVSLRIKSALQSIEILFLKGMYADCLKLIEKTESLARSSENIYLLLDILNWKKKCMGYSLGLLKADEVNHQLALAIDELDILQQITNLYYQSYLLRFQQDKSKSEETVSAFLKIIENPVLTNRDKIRSLPSKVYFYLIYSHYYYVIDESTEEYTILQTLIDLIHASKTYSIENPLDYIAIYVRLLALKKIIGDESIFNDIQILRNFGELKHIQKEIISTRIFVYTYSHEMEFLMAHNKFKLAQEKINEIENGIKELKYPIEPFYLIHFYYMYAVVLMAVGSYEKALKNINTILNTFSLNDRPQIYVKTEILNCFLHFDLENYDLVVHLHQNLLRKHKKSTFFTDFERFLVKKIALLAQKVPTSKNQISRTFHKILSNIKQDYKDELHLLPNQNYIKWIRSKIADTPIINLYEM